MTPRQSAVTIDVDGVRHYHAIHGLPPPSTRDPIVDVGVRRFLDACDRVGVKSTLFVVGADVEAVDGDGDTEGAFASLLRKAARDGHEIASHSFAHDYALTTRAPSTIDDDIARSVRAIEAAVGARPVGFRAPGYNINAAMFDALEHNGFAYDSSLLPSPAYFALRAGHIAMQRMKGAPSSSIVGDARHFAPRTRAFRPKRGAPFRAAKSRVEGYDVVELPIASFAFGAVPFFGTGVTLAPSSSSALLAAAALASASPCVLELHAIDFVDRDDGFDDSLIKARRDLRVSAKKKIARIESVLRVMAQASDVVTLAASEAVSRAARPLARTA